MRVQTFPHESSLCPLSMQFRDHLAGCLFWKPVTTRCSAHLLAMMQLHEEHQVGSGSGIREWKRG